MRAQFTSAKPASIGTVSFMIILLFLIWIPNDHGTFTARREQAGNKRGVNAHLRTIYSKLGMTSRHASTLLALEHYLIKCRIKRPFGKRRRPSTISQFDARATTAIQT